MTTEQAYGKMSVTELRALVKGMKGAPAVSRMKKGDLLNFLLGAERAQQAAPETVQGSEMTHTNYGFDDAALPPSGTNDGQGEISNADEGAPEPTVAATPTGLDSKGVAKAGKLQAALEPYGWSHAVLDGEDGRVTAVLRRGGETLTVVWHAGVYNYDESAHLVHDRTTRLRNVSAAIKLGSRPQEAVEAEYGKVIANRRFRPASTKTADGHLQDGKGQAIPLSRRLFPAPGEVTQDELFAALAGYRVVWVNRVSNTTESGTVSKYDKFFKLDTNPAGEPVVQFCTEFGFRACRVADIVSTSRKAGKARRTKTMAEAQAA